MKVRNGAGQVVAPRLGGSQVVVYLVQRYRGPDDLEGLFGVGKVAAVIAAQAQKKLRLEVMRVGPVDAPQPTGCTARRTARTARLTGPPGGPQGQASQAGGLACG